MMCFHFAISTLYSVIQAIASLLSRLYIVIVVMNIHTARHKVSCILHAESMAIKVIKESISQLS